MHETAVVSVGHSMHTPLHPLAGVCPEPSMEMVSAQISAWWQDTAKHTTSPLPTSVPTAVRRLYDFRRGIASGLRSWYVLHTRMRHSVEGAEAHAHAHAA